MTEQKVTELDDRVFASMFQEKFDTNFLTKLGSDQMRCKVKEIFGEEIGKVDFANTVKRYASEEMDKRIFRSAQYWLVVIATSVVTGAISIFISKIFK